jgi:hypothetical protein
MLLLRMIGYCEQLLLINADVMTESELQQIVDDINTMKEDYELLREE